MASLTSDSEKNRAEFFALLAKRGNETCADCASCEPTWVSINLGVFICAQCAGVHRSLGTHISKVQSLKLDTLDDDELKTFKAAGSNNAKANILLEYAVPLEYYKPVPDEPRTYRERYIREKYVKMTFRAEKHESKRARRPPVPGIPLAERTDRIKGKSDEDQGGGGGGGAGGAAANVGRIAFLGYLQLELLRGE